MVEQDRHVLAAEVLELGEQLFAYALEGGAKQETDEKEATFPRAEIEAASREFFTALRLLLHGEQM